MIIIFNYYRPMMILYNQFSRATLICTHLFVQNRCGSINTVKIIIEKSNPSKLKTKAAICYICFSNL